MIRIDPNALYSRADLIEMLKVLGIDADGFISRVKPKKRFRLAWFGRDILDAIYDAPVLGEVEKMTPQASRARRRKGSRSADIEEFKRIQRGE